jgi:hypothetical protein
MKFIQLDNEQQNSDVSDTMEVAEYDTPSRKRATEDSGYKEEVNNSKKANIDHTRYVMNLDSPKIYFRDGRIEVEPNNYLLRDKKGKKLLERAELVYGKEAANQMLELGNDQESVEQILQEAKEQGANKILDILFAKESPEPVLTLEMTNYLLQDEKGKELLEKAELFYGKEAVNQILELGNDKESVEQILQEAKEQGTNKILDILFGATDQKAISDFSKIIENEDSPGFYQYIYNALSSNKLSKPAIETIKYITHVYDKLEEMLSEGSSGNKVTIAITILESLLSYAGSGQLIGYRPSPYKGLDDGGDGPGGGNSGGVYFENNNGQEDNGMNYILLSINTTELVGDNSI